MTSPGNIKGSLIFFPPPLFVTLLSSLTLLDDSSSSNRPSQHEMSTFNCWASVPLGVHSFIIHSSETHWLSKRLVRCLIPALSFETVFFHVRIHSTKVFFLAVIKLLETHQYSCPHSDISFLLDVTGQTTICSLVKCVMFLYVLFF